MLRVPRGRVCAKPDKSQIRCNRRQDPPPASPSALRLCESAAKGRRGAHWGRGSLSPSPTHRLTREWPAPSPVRLRPSAALPAAEFSPSVHRTLVVSRELQVFGVGVGVSVRAWVQWEAVREGSRCVGPICAVSRTGSCSPGSTSVVTLPTGARSLGNDS
uniref:Uncharacterized protein n=1 Tax=Rangifer tarandus platyrhynchus TaxID=3082113 RepID=A0ACB0FIH1_RANTA|nr:unnamed protein product [Rangifer tarandus platyrhynchus]